MSQALYRKYRPRSLEEAVGQEHITQTLGYALKEGRISHAYLFTGPRGTGKTSIARILAYAINEVPYEDGASALDIIEIDAASNNGVEDIRDLREKVLLAPLKAKYKVYIIDETHMLSTAAFNALLKTLEEPPAHVVFILATTEVHKLPATIISRTQRFHFAPIERSKMIDLLKEIAKKEKVGIDDEALAIIADYSAGGARDGVSLLDQIISSASGQPVTAQLIRTVLGLPPKEMVDMLMASLLQGEVQKMLGLYEQLLAQGVTPATLITQLIRELRTLTATDTSLYELIDELVDAPRAYDTQLKLEVILATYAAKQAMKEQKSEEPPKPPKPTSSHPSEGKKTEVPKKTTAEPVKSKARDKEEPVEKPKSKVKASKELDEASWQETIASAKAKSPALYTVLRQAIPHFDTENGVLTLTYRFPVHQKRLEQARYLKILSDLLEEVLGAAPKIEIVLNKNAVRHIPKPSAVEISPEKILPDQTATSTVLNIMGGGEPVDV